MRYIITVLVCMTTINSLAQFKDGGNKTGVGFMPAMVSSLAFANAATNTDLGVQVYNLADSQMYRWNGSSWVGRKMTDYSSTYVMIDSFNLIRDSLRILYLRTDTSKFYSKVISDARYVMSVNGLTGGVVLTTTNISEGNNQYFTAARAKQAIAAYAYSGSTVGTTGNVVFYLTSDKTSTGTALFSSEPVITPIVNDASANYTYGWTLSADKKMLTVNVKYAPLVSVALVGLVLAAPINVAAGIQVRVMVKAMD